MKRGWVGVWRTMESEQDARVGYDGQEKIRLVVKMEGRQRGRTITQVEQGWDWEG